MYNCGFLFFFYYIYQRPMQKGFICSRIWNESKIHKDAYVRKISMGILRWMKMVVNLTCNFCYVRNTIKLTNYVLVKFSINIHTYNTGCALWNDQDIARFWDLICPWNQGIFCKQQQSRFPSLHKCFAYLKIISILKLITQVLPSILMLKVCFSACSLQSLLCMHSCVFKKSMSLLRVLSKTISNFLIVFPFYNS